MARNRVRKQFKNEYDYNRFEGLKIDTKLDRTTNFFIKNTMRVYFNHFPFGIKAVGFKEFNGSFYITVMKNLADKFKYEFDEIYVFDREQMKNKVTKDIRFPYFTKWLISQGYEVGGIYKLEKVEDGLYRID